ncbi:MAG: HEAT repeat domain-containing protein, partial [Phycisphaerales bacterium]
DGQPDKAIPEYVEALNDKHASVRYWAVIGLHHNCKGVEIKPAQKKLTKALKDNAAVVRIAAAHALCDWGYDKEALPILAETLKDKNDKARVYAITAMNKIGEKARPVLPQIKAALKDSDEFVQRVARATTNQLKK